jgi:hypothetical protein
MFTVNLRSCRGPGTVASPRSCWRRRS